MSNKELVIAYLKEWDGKDVNPSNWCHIEYIDDPFGDDGVMAWEVCMKHSRAFLVYDDETYQCDEDFEIAARILRLEIPQAAPIKWVQLDEFRWCGDGYMVESHGGAGWACYFGANRLPVELKDIKEDAFAACQAHKQRRYDDLGGR